MRCYGLIALLFATALMLLFTSCEKMDYEEVNETSNDFSFSNVKVINGILWFNSKDDFFNTLNFVINTNENILDQWEQQIGFLSLRRLQNKALDELDTIKTEEGLDVGFYNIRIYSKNLWTNTVNRKLFLFMITEFITLSLMKNLCML